MAHSESVVAASPVSEEDLSRAEEFTREPFLHEGEEAGQVVVDSGPLLFGCVLSHGP